MSRRTNGILGLLTALAVVAAVVAVTARRREPELTEIPPAVHLPRYPGELVALTELSVGNIGEIGDGTPVLQILLRDYLTGDEIKCHHCGVTYIIGPLNTSLHSFLGLPGDTYAMHACPGPKCVPNEAAPYGQVWLDTKEDRLARYLAAHYRLVLDDPALLLRIRQLHGVSAATQIQLRIYDATMEFVAAVHAASTEIEFLEETFRLQPG